jgi:hypothetical protein
MTTVFACRAFLPTSSPFDAQQIGHVSLSLVLHPEGCVVTRDGTVHHAPQYEILLDIPDWVWAPVRSVEDLIRIRDRVRNSDGGIATGRVFASDEDEGVEVVARCIHRGSAWLPARLAIGGGDDAAATFAYGWDAREVSTAWSPETGCQVATMREEIVPVASGTYGGEL